VENLNNIWSPRESITKKDGKTYFCLWEK
jgi:hypothetical protein